MISQPDYSDKLAVDSRSLDQLKLGARNNSPEALKAVSQQFESVFMNMMLKSMRDAGGQDGVFDNEQTKMFTSMLDQQITQKVAGKGMGLADALYKQLLKSSQGIPGEGDAGGQSALSSKAVSQYQNQQDVSTTSSGNLSKVAEFKQKMLSHAQQASQQTGIPAEFMLGQAALESGWGKREIKTADGGSSHNVFGIKAGAGWKGKTVNAVTTEYVNGVAHKRVEKFKAYDNYGDAFKDYAALLSNNPRYSNVIANAKDANSFAQGLQKAGYATDPQYANKLSKIIRQTISV